MMMVFQILTLLGGLFVCRTAYSTYFHLILVLFASFVYHWLFSLLTHVDLTLLFCFYFWFVTVIMQSSLGPPLAVDSFCHASFSLWTYIRTTTAVRTQSSLVLCRGMAKQLVFTIREVETTELQRSDYWAVSKWSRMSVKTFSKATMSPMLTRCFPATPQKADCIAKLSAILNPWYALFDNELLDSSISYLFYSQPWDHRYLLD